MGAVFERCCMFVVVIDNQLIVKKYYVMKFT